MAQWGRTCLQRRRRGFNPSQEDPLEEEMATDCRILAWRIPWTEEAGGLSPWGCKRVRHHWARTHIHYFKVFMFSNPDHPCWRGVDSALSPHTFNKWIHSAEGQEQGEFHVSQSPRSHNEHMPFTWCTWLSRLDVSADPSLHFCSQWLSSLDFSPQSLQTWTGNPLRPQWKECVFLQKACTFHLRAPGPPEPDTTYTCIFSGRIFRPHGKRKP